MPTLHARGVPAETYEALRRLAEERSSSIGVEAVRLIRRALRTDRPDLRQLLDVIESMRPRVRRRGLDGAALIRHERDRKRR